MEEIEGGNEQGQSKYNSAMAQLYRLDALWNSAHKHALAGKLDSYKFTLDRVWVELAPDSKKPQYETQAKFIKFLNQIARDIRNLEAGKKPDTKINGTLEQQERILRGRYYSALQRYEVFLRRILNSQGKGSAYKDTTSEDIE